MISIVNYGMGNIRSIQNALDFLGLDSRLIKIPEEILNSEKIILPGVGSFRRAMENIQSLGIENALTQAAMENKVPTIGICLGMQLLTGQSEEDGTTKGLGWIPGKVEMLPTDVQDIKIPHIGFNRVKFSRPDEGLYSGLGEGADFYFVHSYRMICDNEEHVSGWVEYGERFAASVHMENIYGVQYHPEKSQSNGLMVLKKFGEI